MKDHPPPSHELAVVNDVPGEFAERVVEAFHCRPDELFGLALTGGGVAAECYERLATHAETQIDWWQVELFLTDECRVDLDHDDSHERLVRLMLLDRVGAAHFVYPLRDDATLDAVDRALAERSLDLVHLDLGPDGRLSSWFPPAHGSSFPTTVRDSIVATNDPTGALPHRRFSLAPAVLDRAACVVITAVGSAVADALAAMRSGADVPGSALRAARVVWLADPAAARTV